MRWIVTEDMAVRLELRRNDRWYWQIYNRAGNRCYDSGNAARRHMKSLGHFMAVLGLPEEALKEPLRELEALLALRVLSQLGEEQDRTLGL